MSSAILPAGLVLFKQQRVLPTKITEEFKEGTIHVFLIKNPFTMVTKHAYVYTSGHDPSIGTKNIAHHDQSGKRIGEYEIVDEIYIVDGVPQPSVNNKTYGSLNFYVYK